MIDYFFKELVYSLQNRWTLKRKLSDHTMINIDVNRSIQTFVSKIGFESDIIPLDVYLSPNENTVSSVNELHIEAKNLIKQKDGIITRYLQRYLD